MAATANSGRSPKWQHIAVQRIEDLSDAVRGAGLEAMQMSTGPLSGSLVFSEHADVTYSSGLVHSRVELTGPLSQDFVTVGAGLRFLSGCSHWLADVESGSIGVFHAGDEHHALYTPGALYATATLSIERLEEEAANEELVLDRNVLGGTGIFRRRLTAGINRTLTGMFEQAHADRAVGNKAGPILLGTIIEILGRPPVDHFRHRQTNGHARVVEKARSYIVEHLGEPISLDMIAAAACTSRRTLQRAFADVLDDTPQSYVRRLRLHRIRHDLANDVEKACTIAIIANEWGISELGRLSGWYRELFGEPPSETLARTRNRIMH